MGGNSYNVPGSEDFQAMSASSYGKGMLERSEEGAVMGSWPLYIDCKQTEAIGRDLYCIRRQF
jgi:hypothetical protein